MSTSLSTQSRRWVRALREPLPTAWYAVMCRISVVLLGLIVVTGAAVRLTKSGLGCPTWPQCGDGSFVTRSEFSLHGVIEFGNRMLTIAVGLVVAVVVLGSFRLATKRTDLRWISSGLVLGFIAQGVLGGLTVIFHLNPFLVAGHFLVSMLLLWNAAVLDTRARQDQVRPVRLVKRELVILADLLAVAAAVVLIAGTVVTGAGPHSGDAGDVQRFAVNIRGAAQLHADTAMVLSGLVIAMAFAVRLIASPSRARRLSDWLVITVIAQIAIGFTQYFLGIPTGLVAVHVAGATLLWVFALYLRLSLTTRAADLAPPQRTANRASDQLVDGDGDEQQRQVRDRQVEQPHRPRVTTG
jgi:cytochrome c oxidase assembly protein subunit 15